jgi:glutamine phosphoribosylpyrophosphate amidotransferase
MCGVIGYYTEKSNNEDLEILTDIFYQSKIRGIHSFGITYKDNKSFTTNKQFNINRIKMPDTNMLIGHNRYSTSGDWKIKRNNQPIEYNDNYLVFNGVIDMGTKKEIESKYNIKMQSNNDGEIILQKPEMLKHSECSFAGLFIEDSKIYCYRNKERPLFRALINKSVFIASTKDIFKRAGIKDVKPVIENTKIELKEFFDKNYGIQKVSYPNDAMWGYRPSIQLPTLSR